MSLGSSQHNSTKARAFELWTLGREKTRDRFWRGSPVVEWPKAHNMAGIVLLLSNKRFAIQNASKCCQGENLPQHHHRKFNIEVAQQQQVVLCICL